MTTFAITFPFVRFSGRTEKILAKTFDSLRLSTARFTYRMSFLVALFALPRLDSIFFLFFSSSFFFHEEIIITRYANTAIPTRISDESFQLEKQGKERKKNIG